MTATSSRPSPMPRSELIAWCCVYGLFAALITVENALTVVAFTSRRVRAKRKRIHYFLISLSVADILVGSLSLPMYVYTTIIWWQRDGLIVRDTVYNVYIALDIFSAYASIITIPVIALERLYAIGWPLRYRCSSRKHYCWVITLIWVVAAVLPFIYLMFIYGFIPPPLGFYLHVYIVRFSVFLSVFVTCIAYSVAWIRIKLNQQQVFNPQRESREKRLALTMFIVSVIFAVTWLPFNIMTMVYAHCRSCAHALPDQVGMISKLMHYGNSLANPVVYTFREPEFRGAILNLCGLRKPHIQRQQIITAATDVTQQIPY